MNPEERLLDSRGRASKAPLSEPLLQEELLVTLGEVVERAENLVAALLVERPGLERMRVERHRVAAALARIGFGPIHQPGGPAIAALGFVDPEIGDVQPTAPDAAQQAAHDLVAIALQEEIHRIVGGDASGADIENVEMLAHELGGATAFLGKDDLQLSHGRAFLPAGAPEQGSNARSACRCRPSR